MARFYGTLKGQARTRATRAGSADSGVRATVAGWNAGLLVAAESRANGSDEFHVSVTGGSNDRRTRRHILEVAEVADGAIAVRMVDPRTGRLVAAFRIQSDDSCVEATP